MSNWRSLIAMVLLAVNVSAAVAAEGNALPPIKSRVNDHAAVLSRDEMNRLYQISAQHQFVSKNHVVVVTVSSAGSEPLEGYAKRIWDAWQPRKKSNSVMLLLIKEQKGAAIIAGDALSKELNAVAIKKIIDEKIASKLQQGDYDGAAEEGMSGILAEIGR